MGGAFPLYGLDVAPLAYDARSRRDFLFATTQPELRFVLVHFTWAIEPDPRWPFIKTYRTLDAFQRAERRPLLDDCWLWVKALF